jgi:hypothetical protein
VYKKIFIFTLGVLFFSYLPLFLVHAGEKDVLKALEKIKGAVEVKTSNKNFCELLTDAKVEINIYERQKEKNACFMEAVNNCFTQYKTFEKYWSNLMAAEISIPENEERITKHHDMPEVVKLSTFLVVLGKQAKKEAAENMPKCINKAETELDKAYSCMN